MSSKTGSLCVLPIELLVRHSYRPLCNRLAELMLISERSSLRNAILSIGCTLINSFARFDFERCFGRLPARLEWTNCSPASDSGGWPLCLDWCCFLADCLPTERCLVWFRYRLPGWSLRSLSSVWPSSWRLWTCWMLSDWLAGWSPSRRPLNSQLIFLIAGLA